MNTKKEKSIKTPELKVEGNIMSWEGMMIQLSNVSCISTAPLEQLAFPVLSILLVLLGTLGLKENPAIGILLLAAGGIWVYAWYYFNEKRKMSTILSIAMNSGNSLQFLINNKIFLEKVLQVLEQIIINGGVGNQNVTINIRGNKFSGNAQVLNDLDLL